MKHCLKCHQLIDENNPKEKYCMIITKLGLKIIAFECFHFNCWKQFWDDSIEIALNKRR